MPRPQKLTFMNGKRVLMDYATRKDEYHNYNKDRWRFQKELKQFYIEGLTLKEIALELKHDYGYIRKTHAEIIKKSQKGTKKEQHVL